MWVPFDTFGAIKGRVRGVSQPHSSGLLVWTDQGLFSLWYFRSAFVTRLAPLGDAESAFDSATGVLTWNGSEYPMLGPCAPGNVPRTRHPGGERVAIDPDEGSIQVLDAAGSVQQVVDVVPVGDWAVAAFSVDGKALVVAHSAGVRLFRYEAATGAERPRWAAVASADDQNRLLRAILAHPDEDTPRLMYADWLDEHDDPARAEYIRVQCRHAERAAREPVPANDPDHQRAFQLGLQMGPRWLAELPVIRGVKWFGFWRGFPAVSVVSPTTLVRAGAKIWAAAPVQSVTITGLNPTGARVLAGSEVLGRLRVLALENYSLGREGETPLRTLFHAPGIAPLKRLSLPAGIGEAGVLAVVASPHLTGLEWLSVGSGGLTDAAAAALASAPALRTLRGGSFVSYRLSAATRKRLQVRFPSATV